MKVYVEYDHKRDQVVVNVRLENGHHHTECVSLSYLMQKPEYIETHSKEPYQPRKREKIHIAPGCDTVEKLNSALFYYTPRKNVDIVLSPRDWTAIAHELSRGNSIVWGYDAMCGRDVFMFLNKRVYAREFGELAVKSQPNDKPLPNTKFYSTDVGNAGIEEATAEPKTDADKAVDDAIERSKPVEKPQSWEERIKKELNEGVDTWGRIAKKHKHTK